MFEIHHFSSPSSPEATSRSDQHDKEFCDFFSEVNPLHVMICTAVLTAVVGIMIGDVLDDGHWVIVCAYAMKCVSLLLMYMLVLHMLTVKHPGSCLSWSLLIKNFHIPPRALLNTLTILGIFGCSLSYAAKAVTTCEEDDFYSIEPCCCNEFIGKILFQWLPYNTLCLRITILCMPVFVSLIQIRTGFPLVLLQMLQF